MQKLLIIIAVIAAIIIIKRLITTPARSKTSSQPEDPGYKNTVRCEYCGTHVPISSAYKAGGRFFCTKQHYLEQEKNT